MVCVGWVALGHTSRIPGVPQLWGRVRIMMVCAAYPTSESESVPVPVPEVEGLAGQCDSEGTRVAGVWAMISHKSPRRRRLGSATVKVGVRGPVPCEF